MRLLHTREEFRVAKRSAKAVINEALEAFRKSDCKLKRGYWNYGGISACAVGVIGLAQEGFDVQASTTMSPYAVANTLIKNGKTEYLHDDELNYISSGFEGENHRTPYLNTLSPRTRRWTTEYSKWLWSVGRHIWKHKGKRNVP